MVAGRVILRMMLTTGFLQMVILPIKAITALPASLYYHRSSAALITSLKTNIISLQPCATMAPQFLALKQVWMVSFCKRSVEINAGEIFTRIKLVK